VNPVLPADFINLYLISCFATGYMSMQKPLYRIGVDVGGTRILSSWTEES